MSNTKQNFGRFVADRRRTVGLTQRELAGVLHVTESAVSKWERGLSYPDVTMVPELARTLGVSSDELISASENRDERKAHSEARAYRTWRRAILLTTAIAYGTALLATFITNISVQHTLSWFWIVLAAVALAFSLTMLPLLPAGRNGWVVLAAATVSLVALLSIVALLYGGGSWLLVSISAILFAAIIIFVPIWISTLTLPAPFSRHKMVVALVVMTLALFIFIAIVLAATGRPDLILYPAYAIVIAAIVPVWIGALLIRYVPLSGLAVAAIVIALSAVVTFFFDSIVDLILGNDHPWAIDFTRWDGDFISGNVQTLTTIGLLLVAVILAVAAGARASGTFRRREAREG